MILESDSVALVMRSASFAGHSIEQVFANHLTHLGALSIDVVELSRQKPRWRVLRSLTDYELIHVTGHVNWVITCLFWKRSVLTIHDIGRYRELSWPKSWAYLVWWVILPTLCASRITVVSQYTRQQLIAACPFAKEKIEVVYNGVPNTFSGIPRPKNDIPRVLQVGTAAHKNAEGTVVALEGLEVKLVLIGRRRAELERLLSDKGVEYEWLTGISYEEVRYQYGQCDVVVFPSFHEGFGLPIIEAQAVGRPVIASNSCSLPEVGGHGAVFVDPNDIDALRREVVSLLNDDHRWETMVQRGRANLERFSSHEMAAQLARIYIEVLASD